MCDNSEKKEIASDVSEQQEKELLNNILSKCYDEAENEFKKKIIRQT